LISSKGQKTILNEFLVLAVVD